MSVRVWSAGARDDVGSEACAVPLQRLDRPTVAKPADWPKKSRLVVMEVRPKVGSKVSGGATLELAAVALELLADGGAVAEVLGPRTIVDAELDLVFFEEGLEHLATQGADCP